MSEGLTEAQWKFQGVETSCPQGIFPELSTQGILAGMIFLGRLSLRLTASFQSFYLEKLAPTPGRVKLSKGMLKWENKKEEFRDLRPPG